MEIIGGSGAVNLQEAVDSHPSERRCFRASSFRHHRPGALIIEQRRHRAHNHDFSLTIGSENANPALAGGRRLLPTLMRYPPGSQLPQDRRLASHRHLARPLSIDPQAETAPGSKRQIDQFDAQSLFRFKIANDHAVVGFGARHAPFYKPKHLKASDKSKIIVHNKKYTAVYTISSTSS
jgi:hypothetical protein